MFQEFVLDIEYTEMKNVFNPPLEDLIIQWVVTFYVT